MAFVIVISGGWLIFFNNYGGDCEYEVALMAMKFGIDKTLSYNYPIFIR